MKTHGILSRSTLDTAEDRDSSDVLQIPGSVPGTEQRPFDPRQVEEGTQTRLSLTMAALGSALQHRALLVTTQHLTELWKHLESPWCISAQLSCPEHSTAPSPA